MGKDPKTELPTLRLKNGNAVHLAARHHRRRSGERLHADAVPVAELLVQRCVDDLEDALPVVSNLSIR